MSKIILTLGVMFGVMFGAQEAQAADGLLVVGTKAKVEQSFAGKRLHPQFPNSADDAIVAVRLTRGEMTIYECDAVDAILDLVGDAAQATTDLANDVVCFTLDAGSDLWDLLNDVACTAFDVGKSALQCAIDFMHDSSCTVLDGVTWAAETAAGLLECVADFFCGLLPFGGK